MARPVITDEKILRAINEPVKQSEIESIINELEESLALHPVPGIGLAAPQIGINKRAAIIRINTKDIKSSLNLINPVIIEKLGPFIHRGEGCLSIPGQQFDVERYGEVFIKDDLHPAGLIATGLESVAVLHELDHLDGILIKDRVIGKNKIGRNDPCPCGRLKSNGTRIKYKNCHGG